MSTGLLNLSNSLVLTGFVLNRIHLNVDNRVLLYCVVVCCCYLTKPVCYMGPLLSLYILSHLYITLGHLRLVVSVV